MNKRQKPSKKRKGAGIGIAVCFVAAIIMVGTYTLRDYQEAKRQELALSEDETKEKDMREEEPEDGTKEEAGSNLVINTEEDPAADGSSAAEESEEQEDAQISENTDGTAGENGSSSAGIYAQTAGNSSSVNFTESSKLLWPVDGNVLMNYSMDETVYFSTLDQYKYNPALIISGAEGDQVISSTAGVVKSIDENAETGTTVNVDIGNGYELFYGQLKDVTVNTGDYVEAKTVLGYVSQPTKYYSVEGCNVYFEMRKDGQPIDPVTFME